MSSSTSASSHPSQSTYLQSYLIRSLDLLQCVFECAFNLLRGNITLTDAQKAKLTKNKQLLREVASKKVSLTEKHTMDWWIYSNSASIIGQACDCFPGWQSSEWYSQKFDEWDPEDSPTQTFFNSIDMVKIMQLIDPKMLQQQVPVLVNPSSAQHFYLRPRHASHPSENRSQWWWESDGETLPAGLTMLSQIPWPSMSSSSTSCGNDGIEWYQNRRRLRQNKAWWKEKLLHNKR